MKLVTVVGCGQVGANIANRLQKSNHVKIMDTSIRRQIAQQPWGWMRRVTLQQKSRLRLPLKHLDLENKIEGPMIISTNSAYRQYLWKDWLEQTKTDAKFITKEEGIERFGISDRVQLLCDSRDFLFDFDQHKESLIHDLKKTCEWYDQYPIKNIHWYKEKVVGLIDENDLYHKVRGKVVFCLGNQTRQFLKTPTIGIRLAYNVIPKVKEAHLKERYVASWRDNSSIQHFSNYTKIGCGFQGTIDYLPPAQYAHLFKSFLAKPNYSFLLSPLSQMKQAEHDNGTALRHNDMKTCTVDVTPSFLPRIQVIGNAIFIYGMSGSGFTVYEPWFQDLVFDLIEGKTKDNLFSNSHLVNEKSFLY